jgi:1-deoxy-D-xylulose-5-phosphate reductoisomerase
LKDKKKVVILGSTGTIGRMSIDVIKKIDGFEIVGIASGKSIDLLLKQKSELPWVKTALTLINSDDIDFCGEDAIEGLLNSTNPDIVIVGISGFVGLKYALLAAKYSKRLCLANKESIIAGGNFFFDSVKSYGCEIIPVDSEHNAVFQLLDSERSDIAAIYITASGGAIRDLPIEKLKDVTPEAVLKHPVWAMGARITVDSSSMFNKGLEIMEAHFLFNIEQEKIRVLVHPEGKIHGMISLKDGTVKALLSHADMRLPIIHALSYPERVKVLEEFEPSGIFNLFPPDHQRYPALDLAYDCLKDGDGARVAYNAADEIAVQAFLERKIGFTKIYETVSKVIDKGWPKVLNDYESIDNIDGKVRKLTLEMINKC